MNTLASIAESLREGRDGRTDVELARVTGITRQSLKRALSGDQNFNVLTLLAIAEANGQVVMVVPREVSRALIGSNQPPVQRVSNMADNLKLL